MQELKTAKLKFFVGIMVLVLGGISFWKLNEKDTAPPESNTGSGAPVTTPSANTATPVVTRKYKDGAYSADGAYTSPAGQETVSVSFVIKDDIIVESEFFGNATNPASKRLQGQFADGFKQHVVGKSIDSISLTVVNGSSLTPKGFMDALLKIKSQAQS